MKAKPTRHPGEVVLELDRRDEPLLAAAGNVPPASLFQLKKILVPMDFSECAKKALRYALPLARQHQAAITLLYVVPRPNYAGGEEAGVDFALLEDQMRTGGAKELAALALAEIGDRAAAQTLVRSGPAAVEILDAARNLPADLIVIATHGRTGLKHALLGSVTEHVVRRAPCPVLVVREPEREFVFPTL